jgi:glycerophosphoryl diester phosphodiesterase
LQGHRGARGLAPENTIEGFACARRIGVDVLELDIGLTEDEIVVVTHDLRPNPDLTRTPDGAWLTAPGPPIRAHRHRQLAAYDVGRIRPGSPYANQFPDQVPRDGARIPTLEAVLQAFPDAHFNIEIKTDPTQPAISPDPIRLANLCADQLAAGNARSRIVVQSFDWRCLRHIQRHHPDIRLSWLTSPATVARAEIWWDTPTGPTSVPRAVAAEGGPIWAPAFSSLTAREIDAAHALGLQVVPWTVNRPDDMARLIGWGVDGLITDRPDLARPVMAQAGLALPEQVASHNPGE